jgi:hypothetical protein
MPIATITTTPGTHISRVVVGHAYSAFRDLGENVTSQIIGATHKRKTPTKKDEA